MTVGVVTLPSEEKAKHPWMRQLLVPYIVVFSVASVVSVGALAQKARLFVQQIQERHRAVSEGEAGDGDDDDHGDVTILLENVEIPAEFVRLACIKALKAKFNENLVERRRLFCDLLLGLFEGFPRSMSGSQGTNAGQHGCAC